MQAEPKQPYVYQPEPANSPLAPRLYAVAGPGAERYRGERFSKEEAEALLLRIKLGIDRIGHCSRCQGAMIHERLRGYRCPVCD